MLITIIIMFKGHCTRKQPDKSILYNTYYQWVSIFLMAQVLKFIIWFIILIIMLIMIDITPIKSLCTKPIIPSPHYKVIMILFTIFVTIKYDIKKVPTKVILIIIMTILMIKQAFLFYLIIIINSIIAIITNGRPLSHSKAFLFYLPRMIWLSMEGGLMAFLCEGCSGLLSSSASSTSS